ncbi:MAG: hypothetical protein O3B86_12615 [Planctomycetota bacterium]|nr:hypothetical protein [Planctomycetota bacterium]
MVIPVEDAKAFEAANLIKNGRVVVDSKAVEARDGAIVRDP